MELFIKHNFKGGLKMTKHEAIQIILDDRIKNPKTSSYGKHPKSLVWAINYCKEAMDMEEGSNEFKVQIIYILNNIIHWQHPQASEVRKVLRS
jgi:hypothetical protein